MPPLSAAGVGPISGERARALDPPGTSGGAHSASGLARVFGAWAAAGRAGARGAGRERDRRIGGRAARRAERRVRGRGGLARRSPRIRDRPGRLGRRRDLAQRPGRRRQRRLRRQPAVGLTSARSHTERRAPLSSHPHPLSPRGEGLGMRAVTPSTPQRTAMPSTPARQSSTTATLPEVPVPRVAAQVAPTPTSAPGTKPVTIARGGRLFQTSTFEQETAPDGRPMMAGSLLVKFRSSASQATRDVVHQAAGALAVERLGLADLARVQIRPGTVTQALAAYRGRADVERAEPDYVLRKTFTPNDPSFGQQYGMAKIQAPAAWDVTHSSFGIRIA